MTQPTVDRRVGACPPPPPAHSSDLVLQQPPETRKSARFDATGIYRYNLLREWNARGPRLCWILLNPSIADSENDDPTIRRVIAFSKAWGYGSLIVVNLFALRSTSPQVLRQAPDPIGPGNDAAIQEAVRASNATIAAWGIHGKLHNRDSAVLSLICTVGGPTGVLGVTAGGCPRHPLYVPASTVPLPVTRSNGRIPIFTTENARP